MRPLVDTFRAASACRYGALSDDEIAVALALRLNMLLIGHDVEIERMLASILPQMAPCIAVWGERSTLDRLPQHLRTVVVRNVGRLTHDDQQRLNDCLDTWSGAVQVVSTTTRSLLARVERGAFIERLYYRLNTVSVDLRTEVTASSLR
jgi:hypothetical protein